MPESVEARRWSACAHGEQRSVRRVVAPLVVLAALGAPATAIAQSPPPSAAGPANGGALAGADDALPESRRGGMPDGAVRGAATPARVVPRITSLSRAQAATGSTLTLRGARLGRRVESVVFLGAAGDADDATTAPIRVRVRRGRGTVTVRVPLSARTGPVTVVSSDGTQGRPSGQALTVAPPTAARAVASGLSLDAGVQDVKVAFGALRRPKLTYAVRSTRPAVVAVALVRASDGVPVASWTARTVQPNTLQTVTWDGRMAGALAPEGRYRWQIAAQDASGAKAVSTARPRRGARRRASAAQATGDETTFTFLHQLFPIRGPHTYGTFVNSFGGGRGHQGHDVLAACGTPLVATRAGRVRFAGRQGAAGNYVVIDTADGPSHVYMHLRSRPRVKTGTTVTTGQLLGHVGQSGRASGCHLHFEQWPHRWQRGRPENPKRDLTAWDRTS